MGQSTWNPAGPTDRLIVTEDDMNNTLARRIMTCGNDVARVCLGPDVVSQGMLGSLNELLVDCVADCIDILRGEKSDASLNNR